MLMGRFVFASFVLAVAALFLGTPASAQTRLTLFGGPLVPFGDFDEVADLSWTAGARVEFQTVNAIGQRDQLSYFIEGSYSQILADEELELVLEDLGEDSDSSILGAAAGVRVYMRPAPLFISAGAGYIRYTPPADAGGLDGLDLQLGLGFMLPFERVQLEAVAVAHEALLNAEDGFGDEDLQYLTATAGIALPF
jgi:hypothetical protein